MSFSMSCLIFYGNRRIGLQVTWQLFVNMYLVLSSSSPLINFILTFSSANETFGDTLSVAIERPWWPWHLEAHLVFPELETSFTDHRQWWQITLLHIFIFPIFSSTSFDSFVVINSTQGTQGVQRSITAKHAQFYQTLDFEIRHELSILCMESSRAK